MGASVFVVSCVVRCLLVRETKKERRNGLWWWWWWWWWWWGGGGGGARKKFGAVKFYFFKAALEGNWVSLASIRYERDLRGS